RAAGRGPGAAAPAPADARGDPPLLPSRRGRVAGRAGRGRLRTLVLPRLVRQGGAAEGTRPRHFLRPAQAALRTRRRWRAAPGVVRPGPGRGGALAPARVAGGGGFPRGAGVVSGLRQPAISFSHRETTREDCRVARRNRPKGEAQ